MFPQSLRLPPGDFEVSQAPSDTIAALASHPSSAPSHSAFLLSVSWNGEASVHQIGSNSSSSSLKARVSHPAPLLGCAWSVEGGSAWTVGGDGQLRLWDLQRNELTTIGRHSAPIRSVCVSPQNFVVSGSWDSSLACWDPRISSSAPVKTINLGEKVYCMDLKENFLVVGLSNRKFRCFDLRHVGGSQGFSVEWPQIALESPLKFQIRSISALNEGKPGFISGSIEGRCCVQYPLLNDSNPPPPSESSKAMKNFAFKCHRDGTSVFAVNGISFHPSGIFSTVGADGSYGFWDYLAQKKLFISARLENSITAGVFNSLGNQFIYAVGSDWAHGGGLDYQLQNKGKLPNGIAVHTVQLAEIKKT